MCVGRSLSDTTQIIKFYIRLLLCTITSLLVAAEILLTLEARIMTAADDKFCDNIRKLMRIVYSIPYLLFLKKEHNLKLSSAANYRWRLMG